MPMRAGTDIARSVCSISSSPLRTAPAGVVEVEHDAVAEPLHRAAPVTQGGLLHDAREVGGELGRGLVASLLGERRVAGQVEKGDRGRLLRVGTARFRAPP